MEDGGLAGTVPDSTEVPPQAKELMAAGASGASGFVGIFRDPSGTAMTSRQEPDPHVHSAIRPVRAVPVLCISTPF